MTYQEFFEVIKSRIGKELYEEYEFSEEEKEIFFHGFYKSLEEVQEKFGK